MSPSETVARGTVLLVIALLASACETGRDLWPVERLDPYSAVNITIMAEPWVYGRDVRALAANSRDYLNVGLVEANRAGQRSYWLGIVSWSTIDRSRLGASAQPPKPGAVRLQWAESSLELSPAPAGRASLGASEPLFAGPQPVFEEGWYRLTPADLSRFLREPPGTVALLREDGGSADYAAWQVGRRALEGFLEATGADSFEH